MERKKTVVTALLILVLLVGASSPSSAAPPAPAKIVSGFVSNALAPLMKWLWSLKSTTKSSALSGRSMMKFEGGYSVETVFDGSKLGIEPYSVEISPNGDLLVLDSVNSNIYRISQPLSRYSRPRLVAGSSEGSAGHIDGKLREARMNHPKGFTVDDRGNVYVADTMNMAIRKISDTGVTTIAGGGGGGGKWSRAGHVDGPSEDAKFSGDFEVVYVGSSCSLLVIDRGNQAIREIQLNFDDCAYQYGSGFPLGIAVLLAAGFFGYMLALLQRRVGGMVSPEPSDQRVPAKSPYQKPFISSVRPPLIPLDSESEKPEDEGLLASAGKLVGGVFAAVAEIFSLLPGLRKKNLSHPNPQWRHNSWPMQESYNIHDDDEPPPPQEARTPTPRKTYAFMAKNPEKMHQLKQGRAYFGSWEGERKQQVLQQRHYSAGPQTVYARNCETTNEIVFGAVQEADMKKVNYGDSAYDQLGPRYRLNYIPYDHGY